MSYFVWTPELNLGITVIDEQHKCIVDYINSLHSAIELNDKKKAINIAEQVVDYTYNHFTYEEALLKKANYLLTEPHIEVHNRFKQSAEKHKQAIIKCSDMTEAKLMRSELTLWLTNHIQKEDSDYVESVGHLFHKKSFLDGVFNFFQHK